MEMLAPALGRLAAPARQVPFDDVRLSLVDSLVAGHANNAFGGTAWLSAWQRAMEAIRDHVVADANRALDAAAVRSRFPAARLAQLRPGPESNETLLNRLLAEGEALERLDGPEIDDSVTRARGAAVEAGWDAAVRIALAERAHWIAVARNVEEWRRPWRPLVIAATSLLLVLTVLAAMLGGILPAPAWFEPVIDRFWSLPWL